MSGLLLVIESEITPHMSLFFTLLTWGSDWSTSEWRPYKLLWHVVSHDLSSGQTNPDLELQSCKVTMWHWRRCVLLHTVSLPHTHTHTDHAHSHTNACGSIFSSSPTALPNHPFFSSPTAAPTHAHKLTHPQPSLWPFSSSQNGLFSLSLCLFLLGTKSKWEMKRGFVSGAIAYSDNTAQLISRWVIKLFFFFFFFKGMVGCFWGGNMQIFHFESWKTYSQVTEIGRSTVLKLAKLWFLHRQIKQTKYNVVISPL